MGLVELEGGAELHIQHPKPPSPITLNSHSYLPTFHKYNTIMGIHNQVFLFFVMAGEDRVCIFGGRFREQRVLVIIYTTSLNAVSTVQAA